jgi:hypothetical protein
MFNTLLATVLIGAYLGWLLVRPVPLFPNWLGALASAGVTGYATTLEDSVGDLMRYVGYAVVHTASVVTDTAEEVQVRTHTSVHYTVITLCAKLRTCRHTKATHNAVACALVPVMLFHTDKQ